MLHSDFGNIKNCDYEKRNENTNLLSKKEPSVFRTEADRFVTNRTDLFETNSKIKLKIFNIQ